MTRTTPYLCIGCPLGCRLEVAADEAGQIVEVRGFSCKRGQEYAVQEHTAPQRMVTTTVPVRGGQSPRVPVKTRTPVPKALTLAICQALRTVVVTAPVTLGDLIVPDVLGTGVDVVATRSVARATPTV